MLFGVEIKGGYNRWSEETEKILHKMKEAGCQQMVPYLTDISEEGKCSRCCAACLTVSGLRRSALQPKFEK